MNKIITIQFIVILMACLLSPNSIMAGNETVYTVSMQKQVKLTNSIRIEYRNGMANIRTIAAHLILKD